MLKAFLTGVAVVAATMTFTGISQAGTQKGRCAVAASVHGGKKFVTLKCDRANHPGDYIIRSQVWEHKDKERYRKLIPLAGHRFTCDITYAATTRNGGEEWTRYNIGACK